MRLRSGLCKLDNTTFKVQPSVSKNFSNCAFTFFLNTFIYFIYLLLAVLGLRCCMWAFSSGELGLLFVVVHVLLIAVASLVAEHRP